MVGKSYRDITIAPKKEEIDEYLLSKLTDKRWRMTSGMIYRIKDKD
jgi:hypothetical protein